MREFIKDSIEDSIRLKQEIYQSQEFLDEILRVGEETIDTLKNGGKVLLCGNGGSASDAQHLTAEFVSRFRIDRKPLPAVALNCNASILTSIGNDYAYELIFDVRFRRLAGQEIFSGAYDDRKFKKYCSGIEDGQDNGG